MNKKNRLSNSNSPYLRQHENNPVDWYEWGDEALNKAQLENKPLIISIGYAACHWCHVMANESFSNTIVAEYMNAHFVCIKIDREERPDIDMIYMEAAHLISGRGGWPLNAIAMPDGRPFYAATYFPPEQWLNVLQQLNAAYTDDNQRVSDIADQITDGLSSKSIDIVTDTASFDSNGYSSYFENHIQLIDIENGGYSRAPKFPLPIGLGFFLQHYYLTDNKASLQAVDKTLTAMAMGGIYDQIGGGFARYSTDSKWLVPHFEKMLYDNAQLISLYAHAYQLTKNALYKKTIEETISFIERELSDSSNGFYSSIDADSEHEEGKFYVWELSEITTLFDAKTTEILVDYYQITVNGNWEHGKNILHRQKEISFYATKYNTSSEEFEYLICFANEKLLAYRNNRTRPATDDKILCSWNALMITAYVNAFKALGNPSYKERAIETATFIDTKLLNKNGKLLRVYKNGEGATNAFLEDYALLSNAYIQLYEVSFDIHWLQQSELLAKYVLNHFSDKDSNLYFFTSNESNDTIVRKHEITDNVMPSSNSVFAHVLYNLGVYWENTDYTSTSKKMLLQLQSEIVSNGPYYANWAMLLGKFTHSNYEIAITGANALDKMKGLQKEFLPTSYIAGGTIENLPMLKNRCDANKTQLYICKDKICNLPVNSVEEALDLIN